MLKDTVLEVKDLTFGFGKTPVLKNVSFKVLTGDFVGIIGPNGSGKTTLIKIILGIYHSKKGTVKLFGKDISEFSDHANIGYVPQKATSFMQNFPVTVNEVVGMGLLSRKHFPKMLDKKDRQKILNSLRVVSMDKHSERRIGELSGGQQQRVFIARAIVSDPKILFLDEPTTGVDPNSQEKFYDLLGKLNKKGITILLISHDISRITKYVTKIASLNQALEFYGSHAEFCAYDSKHHHPDHDHKICVNRV